MCRSYTVSLLVQFLLLLLFGLFVDEPVHFDQKLHESVDTIDDGDRNKDNENEEEEDNRIV